MLIIEIKKHKNFASIVVFVDVNNKILLLKRPNKKNLTYAGKWGFVGGGSEDYETPKETAIRETAEETALKVLPEDLKLIDKIESPDNREVYVFVCNKYEGIVRTNSVKEEHDDYDWVAIDELSEYDMPDNSMPLIKKALSVL